MSGNNNDQAHLTAITVAKYALVGSIIVSLGTIFAAIIGKVNLIITPIAPSTETKFSLLENALKIQNWIEADQATDTLNSKYLTCKDLQSINELWLKYSNNKFGYSVQREIWESKIINKDYQAFAFAMHWISWKREEDLRNLKVVVTIKDLRSINDSDFIDKVPEGQLPFNGWRISSPSEYDQGFRAFMSKLKRCKI